MQAKKLQNSGFSLIELLLVVTLIGVIASVIAVRISVQADNAKTKTCFHNRSELNSSAERWYIEHNAWPAADLSDIAADIDYYPSSIPVCPVTGTPYTLNATTHRIDGHSSSATPGDH